MKQHIKKQSLLLAIPVIATIAFISFATNAVFAEDATTDVVNDRALFTATDAPRDVSRVDSTDRMAEVKFRGGTNGWAIIGGQALTSEIGITGNAIHQGHGVWKIVSKAEITVPDRHATLDLKGKAAHGKIRLHGTGTLDTGEPFRIFLRGYYAPVYDEQGDFVLAFTAAKIRFTDNGVKIPLIQSGIVHVESVDPSTSDFEEFIEEFDVVK